MDSAAFKQSPNRETAPCHLHLSGDKPSSGEDASFSGIPITSTLFIHSFSEAARDVSRSREDGCRAWDLGSLARAIMGSWVGNSAVWHVRIGHGSKA